MNRVVCIALSIGALVIGCNRTARPWEARPIFPVEGRLFIQGKPAEGVEVTFHPVDSTQRSRPRGVTDAEGVYHLRTNSDGDGAPSGEYVVTLYWPMRSDLSSKAPDEPRAPPDRLGRRFLDSMQSSLRATVAMEPTVLPLFEIK